MLDIYLFSMFFVPSGAEMSEISKFYTFKLIVACCMHARAEFMVKTAAVATGILGWKRVRGWDYQKRGAETTRLTR